MANFRSLKRELSYKNDIVKKLGGETPTDDGVSRTLFPRLLDVLIFAALIGYKYKKRVKLQKDVGEEDIANAQLISSDPNAGYPVSASKYILLIAAAELSKEAFAEALKEENGDTMLTIVEEYANGGLEIIAKWDRKSSKTNPNACSLEDMIFPNILDILE